MADSDEIHVPTDTELRNAVGKIRTSQPGLGLRKVIPLIRDEFPSWSIQRSRLSKLLDVPEVEKNDEKEENEEKKDDGRYSDNSQTGKPTAEPVEPTLPGVLRKSDIRDRIFSPLLAVSSHAEDQIYSHRWRRGFPGLNLLSVNKEIRQAAWNFLVENNVWLRVKFESRTVEGFRSIPSTLLRLMNGNRLFDFKPGLTQPSFMPSYFGQKMCDQLTKSIAVEFRLSPSESVGDSLATPKVDVAVTFAFHAQRYRELIRDLAETVKEWKRMTVEVNHEQIYKFSDMITVVVGQIIHGVGEVREADRVDFPRLQEDHIDPAVDFDAIARKMTSTIPPLEIHSRLLKYQILGLEFARDHHHIKAFSTFHDGFLAYGHYQANKMNRPRPADGSIESNMIMHEVAETKSLMAETMNREIARRLSMCHSEHTGPHPFEYDMQGLYLNNALGCAHDALRWVGITDTQRFYGHHHSAVAFANMADFLTALRAVVPKPEQPRFLSSVNHQWRDAGECYIEAAQHAFFAIHAAGLAGVDAPQQLLDDTHALRRRLCAKFGPETPAHLVRQPEMAKMEVPMVGPWEGDPRLVTIWDPALMALMALFRRRDCSNPADSARLEERLRKMGYNWVYDVRGHIHLSARVSTTWARLGTSRDDAWNGSDFTLRAANSMLDWSEMGFLGE
ncbi:hypothetical protein diail_2005 [Diaporthe ilicicola]|nr:hypothetical protein diail_2005 [Diaporthe ilicicola]